MTVTFDGKPLDFADLNFVPEPGNTHVTPGAATTDEAGEYRARYQGRFGLSPGTYKVTIRKVKPAQDLSSLPVEMQNDPAQLEMSGLLEQSLPDAYADLNKTSFTIEVQDGGGPYPFALDSKGR